MAFDTLSIATIALAFSFVLSEVFFKLKYPRVIGQILAGILLGLPFLRVIFDHQSLLDIQFLSDLGIIFLLLITGMKINLEKFKKTEKATIIIAIFSIFTPFVLGFILMKAVGYSNLVAAIVGIVISLTAEGTNLKVLLDMKALNTKVGLYILGAGILDDIFEVLFLSVVLVLAQKSYSAAAWLPVKLLIFIGVILLTYKLFPKVLKMIQHERSRIATISFIIIFGLIIAVISKQLDLGPIIGAFIAGVIIHLSDKKKAEFRENLRELEAITFAFIIPFFFVNIGLNFDVTTLTNTAYLTIMILLVATTGKIMGALIARPFTDLTIKQAHLVGWGLNSRGAIELVIAGIALANGLLPVEIYSALVITAIITTLAFPVVMKGMIAQDKRILG